MAQGRVPHHQPELRNPFGIALNVESNRIYWTDRGRDAIGSAELDGSNIQYIVTTGLDNTVGLRLDKAEQKLYWADWGTDKIQRCNLDGSGIEDIITTGLTSPYDVAFLLPKASYTGRIMEMARSNVQIWTDKMLKPS